MFPTATVLFVCSYTVGLSFSVVINHTRRFPDDFLFGVGTAAYQSEGGWDADGKGESIWDHMTHTHPELIADHSNADIASDSYHKYKRDVEMMRELGLDSYRFSISWPRILPNGFANYVNEAGVAYYNNLIDELLKYNITPMITIYHWDLPQKLQEMGGLLNPLIADWFEDFARVVYARFGDRVKYFITFNEAYQICYDGYAGGNTAPGIYLMGIGEYICAKNLLLAHAKAYHAYNNDFKPTQGGICGFTINIASSIGLTDSKEDHFSVELHAQSHWILYTDPIFSKEGGFPKEIMERVAEKSAKQGYPRSRLSDFTEEEKALVRGTSDFFGLNHYSGTIISTSLFRYDAPVPSTDDDLEIGHYVPIDWATSSSGWLNLMPNSLYIALKRVYMRYPDFPIYVTESGWSSFGGLEDEGRINYCRAALESILDALEEGINVKGYYIWTLMDNFEWMSGFKQRFGLYEVDFQDPERTRRPRKSAFVYKEIIKSRTIDYSYEPKSYVMTIDEGH